MELTIKAPATVPAGTYSATFEGVEEKTSVRDGSTYLRWSFTTKAGEAVSGVSSTNTGPMSKAYKWLKGLTTRPLRPDEKIDTGALAGRSCLVVLELNAEGFSNVVEVLPDTATDELGF